MAVVGGIPTADALEMLLSLASDAGIAEEAYLAIVNVAGKREMRRQAKDLRKEALETVVRRSTNNETKKKARELLASL